ncbi:MAG: hypothetical protein J5850_06640 [Clostridia bacterium]|nr:hypothetical protein [Clostridia bacterium]
MTTTVKRGKFKLPVESIKAFKGGLATLICADGIVYMASDDSMNEEASFLDKLPKHEMAAKAKKMFSSASCIRISRRGKAYLKDSPSASELLGEAFEADIISEGLILLIPEGRDKNNASFFKDKIFKQDE